MYAYFYLLTLVFTGKVCPACNVRSRTQLDVTLWFVLVHKEAMFCAFEWTQVGIKIIGLFVLYYQPRGICSTWYVVQVQVSGNTYFELTSFL